MFSDFGLSLCFFVISFCLVGSQAIIWATQVEGVLAIDQEQSMRNMLKYALTYCEHTLICLT